VHDRRRCGWSGRAQRATATSWPCRSRCSACTSSWATGGTVRIPPAAAAPLARLARLAACAPAWQHAGGAGCTCCWQALSRGRPMARAVVFFGRRELKPSLKWMGAFWLSVAGAAPAPCSHARRQHCRLCGEASAWQDACCCRRCTRWPVCACARAHQALCALAGTIASFYDIEPAAGLLMVPTQVCAWHGWTRPTSRPSSWRMCSPTACHSAQSLTHVVPKLCADLGDHRGAAELRRGAPEHRPGLRRAGTALCRDAVNGGAAL
jgi:hypothetical protein